MPTGDPSKTLTEPLALVEESRLALQGIRGALIDLFDSVGADPREPQEVARRFELNRNLTWKLSRVVGAADPLSALQHLPGQAGVELAVDAFERAGAPHHAADSVRSAMRSFLDVVKEHAGDREQLELTLESMGMLAPDTASLNGREMAFRGNSSVWGVQARTRLTMMMVAPGSADSTHDYVMLTGLVGLRRLRPSVRWRLARAQTHDDKGAALRNDRGMEEIEPKAPGDTPLIVRSFCSPSMPQLECRPTADGVEICLPAGQVGNRGAFDCYLGYIYRGIDSKPGPNNLWGSAAAPITLPVEELVFDLLVHKDVRMPALPEVKMYGFPHGGPDGPGAQTPDNELPLQERLLELAGRPPAQATPAVPGLSKMASAMYARMGWAPEDFRGLRLVLRHPPMSSRVVMRWPLT